MLMCHSIRFALDYLLVIHLNNLKLITQLIAYDKVSITYIIFTIILTSSTFTGKLELVGVFGTIQL